MVSSAPSSPNFYTSALENHLVSMARTVESCVSRSFEALLSPNVEIASAVFLTEPRINESEILVDEHAVRLLRRGDLSQEDVRHVVATLKINNDLERMGDLAVNICQCAISLISWLPATWSVSRITPQTSPRTLSSGCEE